MAVSRPTPSRASRPGSVRTTSSPSPAPITRPNGRTRPRQRPCCSTRTVIPRRRCVALPSRARRQRCGPDGCRHSPALQIASRARTPRHSAAPNPSSSRSRPPSRGPAAPPRPGRPRAERRRPRAGREQRRPDVASSNTKPVPAPGLADLVDDRVGEAAGPMDDRRRPVAERDHLALAARLEARRHDERSRRRRRSGGPSRGRTAR